MQKAAPHIQGTKKQTPRFTGAVTMLFLLFLLTANPVWAKTYNIFIVSSDNSPVYTRIINTIQTTVSTSENTTAIFSILYLKNTSTTALLQNRASGQDLILTIGQRAMIAVTKISNSPPIIATLIPKQSYDKYRSTLRKANNKTTATFIDNPPERQILLAKLILGDVQRLGVLVGENPPYGKIRDTIQSLGIHSHIETVRENDNLIRKLSRMLSNSDAFLALPDAQIFNRRNAKNILLTTYRQRTPVIAYSASYVKAGALAAIYSTPQQLSEQIGNLLLSILRSKLSFPLTNSYPEKFEVAINKNVAKSLGIPPHDETEIKNKLLKILRGKK
ncbi:hypothetical protein JYT26_00435 [Beggiatoa alba]|nr:hypothetical protein [Beggiatoa alba]